MSTNPKSSLYMALTTVTAMILYALLLQHYSFPNFFSLIIWTVVATGVESLPIMLPGKMATISIGYTVLVAAAIVGGPLFAATVFALSSVLQVRKDNGQFSHIFNIAPHKTLFNTAQIVILAGVMGWLYHLFGGEIGVLDPIPALIVAPMGITLNLVLLTGYLACLHGQSFGQIWQIVFSGTFMINMIQGVFGIIFAIILEIYPWVAVLLLFVSIYVLRYLYRYHVTTIRNYMSTMEVVNRLLEAKDPYTYGHASRVEVLALELAAALGLKPEMRDRIGRAAALHDLGKIGISDTILNKPAELTKEEYEEIKKHPSLGAEILQRVDFLKDCVEIIRHHHERYDGQGYPAGLKNGEIPLESCIISITDAYDAMTSVRPYRRALSREAALAEIKANAGTQFHPFFAQVFFHMVDTKN